MGQHLHNITAILPIFTARFPTCGRGSAPLGLVIAGLGEEELEALAATIEDLFSAPGVDIDVSPAPMQQVPMCVLAQGDLRLRLRDILSNVKERDSVIPNQPVKPQVPLILFSGFNTVQTSAAVKAIRALDLRGGRANKEQPMLAVAVPNALDKTLRMLITELQGDHRELLARRDDPPEEGTI